MAMELECFLQKPETIPLYEAARDWILAAFPRARVAPRRTQVNFEEQRAFVYVWPPFRRVKGNPDVYIYVTFGLPSPVRHPRVQAVEVRHNRWTHHVVVAEPEDLDDELMGWIREAHAFRCGDS